MQYFKHEDTYYAHDPDNVCKTGDIVLIQELRTKKTNLISHEVMKVVFPLGDTTCPLTNKKVVRVKYNVPKYRQVILYVYVMISDSKMYNYLCVLFW